METLFTIKCLSGLSWETRTKKVGNETAIVAQSFYPIGAVSLELKLPGDFKRMKSCQDSDCFGAWCSREHLCFLNYVEGDIIGVIVKSQEAFETEYEATAEFLKHG